MSWRGVGKYPTCHRSTDSWHSKVGGIAPFPYSPHKSFVVQGEGAIHPWHFPAAVLHICVAPTCSHRPCAHTGATPDRHKTDKNKQTDTNRQTNRQADRQQQTNNRQRQNKLYVTSDRPRVIYPSGRCAPYTRTSCLAKFSLVTSRQVCKQGYFSLCLATANLMSLMSMECAK